MHAQAKRYKTSRCGMMRMPIMIVALFFVIAGSAMADGIMVVREEIPPKIP